MAGPRVYIHEFVDITGHQRARYLQHVTANWAPIGRSERGQLCFGVWATVGSTGRWPEVVNLWEYPDWDALANSFEVELVGAGLQDRELAEWWAAAEHMRRGGRDRILVAENWSPSVTDHCREDHIGGAGYVHEVVRCNSQQSLDQFLALLYEVGLEHHRAAGFDLIGAFRRALGGDDEAVVIWSFPDWSHWAHYESSADGGAAGWSRRIRDLVAARERILLADAPLSPLRTGRQPSVEDRRPVEDC